MRETGEERKPEEPDKRRNVKMSKTTYGPENNKNVNEDNKDQKVYRTKSEAPKKGKKSLGKRREDGNDQGNSNRNDRE